MIAFRSLLISLDLMRLPLTISIALVSGNTHIPLSRDPEGYLLLNVILMPSESRPDPMELNFGRGSVAVFETDFVHETRIRIESINANSSFEFEHNFVYFATRDDDPDAYSYMGISPDSPLTQSVGSVAFRRQGLSAELVLASSLDEFTATCVPESIVRFETTFNRAGRLHELTGHVGIVGTDSSMHENRPIRLDRDTFLNVERVIFNLIIEGLIESGAVPTDTTSSFSNCTESNFASLPDIEVFLHDAGRLVLFPEDYVDANEGICRLDVYIGGNADPSFIGLLHLDDMNIRISSNNEWQICDSI